VRYWDWSGVVADALLFLAGFFAAGFMLTLGYLAAWKVVMG